VLAKKNTLDSARKKQEKRESNQCDETMLVRNGAENEKRNAPDENKREQVKDLESGCSGHLLRFIVTNDSDGTAMCILRSGDPVAATNEKLGERTVTAVKPESALWFPPLRSFAGAVAVIVPPSA
jgi:hypothetical protein